MQIKIDRSKLRKLERTTNPFYSLARSIIYQQISTKAGDSIHKKFVGLFGRREITPENFFKLTESQLKSAGLSPQKRIYLKDLAQKFIDKTIDPKRFDIMSDEAIKEHLIQVKGVGS